MFSLELGEELQKKSRPAMGSKRKAQQHQVQPDLRAKTLTHYAVQ